MFWEVFCEKIERKFAIGYVSMKYKIKNYQQNDIHLPTTREKYPYMTKVAPKCTGMTVFIQLKKFSSWVNRNSLLINKDYPETN